MTRRDRLVKISRLKDEVEQLESERGRILAALRSQEVPNIDPGEYPASHGVLMGQLALIQGRILAARNEAETISV